jgi:cobalt-precorrin 5A hydrolase
MALGEAMIVAGIGCRSGVNATEIEAALVAALLEHSVTDLGSIAIPRAKAHESGIVAAAAARRIPIVLIEQAALEAVSELAITRSSRAMVAMNVNSVAEAAALAGAGSRSRLLGARVAVGPVTCALAEGEDQS